MPPYLDMPQHPGVHERLGDGLPGVDPRMAGQQSVPPATHRLRDPDNGSIRCWGNNQYGKTGSDRPGYTGDADGEMGDDLATVTSAQANGSSISVGHPTRAH